MSLTVANIAKMDFETIGELEIGNRMDYFSENVCKLLIKTYTRVSFQ